MAEGGAAAAPEEEDKPKPIPCIMPRTIFPYVRSPKEVDEHYRTQPWWAHVGHDIVQCQNQSNLDRHHELYDQDGLPKPPPPPRVKVRRVYLQPKKVKKKKEPKPPPAE